MVSDVGAIFAAALGKKGADVMTFHDRARYERFNRKDSIVSIAEAITNESGGTNFHSIFESAQAAYDRIIILSDMQAWVGYSTPEDAFKRYRQKYALQPTRLLLQFDELRRHAVSSEQSVPAGRVQRQGV